MPRNIDPVILAIHRTGWLEAEFNARAAFAIVRLDALDRLRHGLTEADLRDAAYAIWDDYIDGRRADERGRPQHTAEIREQASIFARCALYLDSADLLALASSAWSTDVFEVFTRDTSGTITGKLGWYRGDTLQVRILPAGALRGVGITAWMEGGKVRIDVREQTAKTVALHPCFARWDS